jgi:hypothetical protein
MNATAVPADCSTDDASLRGGPAVPALKCECGRELVLCPNGERHCADTLEKFRVKHGYAYGTKP